MHMYKHKHKPTDDKTAQFKCKINLKRTTVADKPALDKNTPIKIAVGDLLRRRVRKRQLARQHQYISSPAVGLFDGPSKKSDGGIGMTWGGYVAKKPKPTTASTAKAKEGVKSVILWRKDKQYQQRGRILASLSPFPCLNNLKKKGGRVGCSLLILKKRVTVVMSSSRVGAQTPPFFCYVVCTQSLSCADMYDEMERRQKGGELGLLRVGWLPARLKLRPSARTCIILAWVTLFLRSSCNETQDYYMAQQPMPMPYFAFLRNGQGWLLWIEKGCSYIMKEMMIDALYLFGERVRERERKKDYWQWLTHMILTATCFCYWGKKAMYARIWEINWDKIGPHGLEHGRVNEVNKSTEAVRPWTLWKLQSE